MRSAFQSFTIRTRRHVPFCLLLVLALLCAGFSQAQEVQTFILETQMALNEKLPVSYYAGATEKISGVLLLQPGINAPGERHVSEPEWQDFARKHRLVIMGVGFKAVGVDTRTTGYYYPEQGSGPAMMQAIEAVCAKTGIPKQPVLVFGFSGGAHFGHRFALWKPEMVRAYAVYAAGWWEKPTAALKNIPGLVSWGSEDYRKTATGDFAREALRLGLPVISCEFSGLGHAVDGRVTRLVQTFFEQTLLMPQKNAKPWVGHAATRQVVAANAPAARQIKADERLVFVDAILAQAWLSASRSETKATPAAASAPARPVPSGTVKTIGKLKIFGDSEGAQGATWTYEATDAGVEYRLNGVLFKPKGTGPFPAVLISHGQGSTANVNSAKMAAEMVKWGLVCLAPNYTFAGGNLGDGAPGAGDWRRANPDDNLKRAGKCLDLLGTLGYVDMKRIAVHGHSMGGFLTVAIAGTFPERVKAASHTAGGEQPYNKNLSLKVRAPYSIHHSEDDKNVSIGCDERFEATLTRNQVPHEMHVYHGLLHRETATDPTVMERIHAWYAKQGIVGR
jgi:dienelactone hydrolase